MHNTCLIMTVMATLNHLLIVRVRVRVRVRVSVGVGIGVTIIA